MRSLRALTILFLVAFAAAVALTGVGMYRASSRAVVALVDRRIAAVADAAVAGIRPGDRGALLARVAALGARRETGDIGFELIGRAGERLGGNVALPRRLALGFSRLQGDDRIVGLTSGRALVRDVGGGLRLTVIGETEPVDDFAEARRRNYLLGFGAIALIVLAGTATFATLIGRRIDAVRATAAAIAAGDWARRVPIPPGGGAFAAQARAFNGMLDRIVALTENLRHVSSDVAHDLRTPLARLRGHLASLADDADAAAIEDAVAQCDALLAMFAAVLRIAEVEGGDRRAGFAPVDLGSLAVEIVDTLGAVAEEGGHALAAAVETDAVVAGDRQLLAQALINLVENALRHTAAGTPVIVSVDRAGKAATIRVRDRGPGIAAADRPRALRRFGRLDASRHRPGHGLGLPLVDAVARLHGGTLSLDDGDPGLVATIALPLPPRG